MAKLYPPYIEGTIPAFCRTVNLDGTVGAKLTVPFSMNKAVSKWEIKGFALKLKNVFGDDDFLISSTTEFDPYLDVDRKVVFHLNEEMLSRLTVGSHYKVQIAYISNDSTGYYSTVGIVKYTTHPTMEMPGLSTNVINMHRYSYIGKYSQVAYEYKEIPVSVRDYKPNLYYKKNELEEYYLAVSEKYEPPYYTRTPALDIDNMKDATEKAYNYRFVMTDFKGNVISDSGYLLHNSNEDLNSYESQDMFSFPSDLQHGKVYYIQYSVITNNNMEVFSPKYRIMQKRSIKPEINATVHAKMDYENGYVDINLVGELDKDGMEKGATGSFLLTRSCSDDNFTVWNEILRFGLHGQKPSRELYRDYTTEQGKTYMYSLQQYNDSGLYSARIKSNKIYADFEDAFLFDGKRQLKIKYNPKISSFKTGLMETKMNTIGSQFPFIFRNGNVAYKEFPLSGLISYQSDEQNLFIKDSQLGLETSPLNDRRPGTFRDDIETSDRYFEDLFNLSAGGPSEVSTFDVIKNNYIKRRTLKDRVDELHSRTTSLVSYNILAERKFKLEVLDWLNDGNVKLFRSPTEGNYLIKLINVSLTPEEKTGRMLHTFSATACEIAEYTHDNMNKYGIISIGDPQHKSLRFESIRLAEYEDKKYDNRYDPAFKYELIEMSEDKFKQLAEEARKNTYLPYYYRTENDRYIQLHVDKEFDKSVLPYYIRSASGVYMRADYVTEEVYNATVEDTLNNILLNFYKRGVNILLQDTYTQVNSNDTFDPKGEYYIRKSFGYLYYVKSGVNLLEAREVTSIRLTDMTPGDTFYLQLENWGKPEVFTIGATGAYLVDTDVNIIYFAIPENVRYTGTLTYSYYEDTSNLFNEVESVDIIPVVAQQFIGDQGNIIKKIENIRDSIANFYYVNVYKRSIGTSFLNLEDNNLYRHYRNGQYSNLIGVSIPPHTGPIETENEVLYPNSIPVPDDYFEDPFMIYSYTRDEYLTASAWTFDENDPRVKIYNPFNFYYDPFNPKQLIVSQETYDRIKAQNVSVSDLLVYSNNVYFDNNQMSIEETQRYYADSEDFVFSSIKCDAGVAIEIGYELQSINYSIMREDPIVAKYYEIYLEQKEVLEKAKEILNPTSEQIEKIIETQKNLEKIYNDFIEVLTEVLRVWEAEQKL